MSLEMNGVDSDIAMELIFKTKTHGKLTIGRTFAD
jgi:hypothetical protein